MGGGWPNVPPPLTDPLAEPLRPAVPGTWGEKEDRVRWVRANLSPGEQALLYKLAHDVDGLRVDRCNDIIRKEKA